MSHRFAVGHLVVEAAKTKGPASRGQVVQEGYRNAVSLPPASRQIRGGEKSPGCLGFSNRGRIQSIGTTYLLQRVSFRCVGGTFLTMGAFGHGGRVLDVKKYQPQNHSDDSSRCAGMPLPLRYFHSHAAAAGGKLTRPPTEAAQNKRPRYRAGPGCSRGVS